MNNEVKILEEEILRLRTTETASAHALDIIRQHLKLDLLPQEHPATLGNRIVKAIEEEIHSAWLDGIEVGEANDEDYWE